MKPFYWKFISMKKPNIFRTEMKFSHVIIVAAAVLVSACGGNSDPEKGSGYEVNNISVPDTGYTGIKQFMSGEFMVSEVTFRNSVREGLTKTFYKSGKLQRTYWYENGLRQDSSCWFYEEGQLFRTTPFVNDTMNGIQKQYYRTGELKAKLGYRNGFRTDFFQEFTRDGKLVKGYPEVIVTQEDNYTKNGSYRITLALTDKKTAVNFRRGDLTDGAYDTTKLKKIKTTLNTGVIDLHKAGAAGQSHVGVVAEILTNFGNRLLVYKKIGLPYNDLQ